MLDSPLHGRLAAWSRWTIVGSTLLFPIAPRIAELCFVLHVVSVALQVRWRERLARRATWYLAATLLPLILWSSIHVNEVWGYGRHSWSHPITYPVEWWDLTPFLVVLFVLALRPLPVREAKAFLWALTATIPLAFCFGAVQQRMTTQWTWLVGTPSFPLIKLALSPVHRLRVDGGYYNANGLGLGITYSFVAAMALLVLDARLAPAGASPSPWRRRFLIACLASSVLLLCWSGSRAAWLWFCFLVIASSLRWRLDPRATLLPLLAGVLLVFLSVRDFGSWTTGARAVVPNVVWERIEGGNKETVASEASWRLRAFACAAELIRERPWSGWGLGSFAPECERRLRRETNHAHNLELQIASELGVPYLALLSALFAWLLWGLLALLGPESDLQSRVLVFSLFLLVATPLALGQLALQTAHSTRLAVPFWVLAGGAASWILSAPRHGRRLQ